jgi:nitroreductase
MDLLDALRSTAAIREFTDEPVSDDVVARVLDTARFAPSGGNKQAWRVVVMKDPATRRSLRDLYLTGWYRYLAMTQAGLRPWSVMNDPADEAATLPAAAEIEAQAATNGGGFAEHLDTVPVLLAVLVDLGGMAAVDRDLGRYTFAGGASVYPFCWNLLLAARAEGLGGVITTMCVWREPEVLEVLGAPDTMALAGVIALGHPTHQPSRLRRDPVESFATFDRIDGEPVVAPSSSRRQLTGLIADTPAPASSEQRRCHVPARRDLRPVVLAPPRSQPRAGLGRMDDAAFGCRG